MPPFPSPPPLEPVGGPSTASARAGGAVSPLPAANPSAAAAARMPAADAAAACVEAASTVPPMQPPHHAQAPRAHAAALRPYARPRHPAPLRTGLGNVAPLNPSAVRDAPMPAAASAVPAAASTLPAAAAVRDDDALGLVECGGRTGGWAAGGEEVGAPGGGSRQQCTCCPAGIRRVTDFCFLTCGPPPSSAGNGVAAMAARHGRTKGGL